MSLTTGFMAAAGVPPRADSGSSAPSGRTAASAAAFAAVAEELAAGAVSGAGAGAGAPGEHAAPASETAFTSASVSASPEAASSQPESADVMGAKPATENWDGSLVNPARSLIGWYFREPLPPMQMLEGETGLPGAPPAPGSGPEPVAAASGAAGSALTVAGEEPALSNPSIVLPTAAEASEAALAPASAGQDRPLAPAGAGAAVNTTDSTPNTAAPLLPAPPHPQAAAAATTVPSSAPSALPSASPSVTALPDVLLPAATGSAPTGNSAVTAKATAPTSPAAPALPGEATPPAASVPPVQTALPGAPVPPGGAPQAAAGTARMAPVSAAAASGFAGLEASAQDAAVVQPPVAPAPMAAPAASPLPGQTALPGGATVLSGGAPQAAAGTARMAPGSAADASGFAGLEVSAKDASVVQPPITPAPMSAPAAVPAAAPAANAPAAAPPQQLLNQVSQPLVRLAAAGAGEHVMTLSVTPENLGPVTVRAVISSDGVRVEMFAPTETARDALRHILVDLRRDLAGGSPGATATLTLADQNFPGNSPGGGAAQADERSGRTPAAPAEEQANAPVPAGRHETSPPRSGLAGTTTALDVMA
ncbi:flagellar hook-length control protein FliK [Arthrobacter sp. UYP6]|uniref:flagellar hook-length control protein FliK n=1 Tax=Arthrobacter sp. UYP6 TaxID=1756378 RepID=UPI003392A66E